MTTEKIHNFNIDSEDMEIIKYFTYFEKITKSKDVLLETKAKIIHTFAFMMCECENWTVKEAD